VEGKNLRILPMTADYRHREIRIQSRAGNILEMHELGAPDVVEPFRGNRIDSLPGHPFRRPNIHNLKGFPRAQNPGQLLG